MSGFGFRGIDEDSPVRTDELVHGRSVGCDDKSAAAHGFDNVVAPTFGERGAEMNWVFVDEFYDVLIA